MEDTAHDHRVSKGKRLRIYLLTESVRHALSYYLNSVWSPTAAQGVLLVTGSVSAPL